MFGGPVVAFIPAVACVPAVVSSHYVAVILAVIVAGVIVNACITAHACIQSVVGILAVAVVLLVPDGFLFLVSLLLFGFLVFGVSAVPFEHAVAGILLLLAFLQLMAFAYDSIPVDPDFPILAGGFTYWNV